ncbi:B9 domain-containing protein 2-like [Aphidius gifuensis]|uniref:B9 domain-containing protein 2-like n=1 Tax=Aphidius gifuensis TaxID=684658 RepID=UPI001CDCC49F|nr:B9 domain-containing protein 2-like [Aphidius gifuensis]
MAELHVFGEIESAENFGDIALFCKWNFHAGNGWRVIDGNIEGQTQESRDTFTEKPYWSHPIDIHYTTQTIQASPKLLLQVFCRDKYSRILFVAYGVCTVPLSPGQHKIKCYTWKPIGNCLDQLRDRFLGITLQLKSPNLLANGGDRFELLTQSLGTVNIVLHVIAKNFIKFGCLL